MIKKLTFPFKLLVTFGLIYWIIQKLVNEMGGSPQLEDLISGNYTLDVTWLGVAFVLLGVSFFGSAIQWWWLVKLMGGSLELMQSIRMYFVGLFFNIFWSVGGDIKKVLDLKKTGGSWAVGFSSTAFDRIFGLFVINFICLAVGLLYFKDNPELGPLLIPSVVIAFVMVAFFCAMFSRHLMRYLQWGLTKCKLAKVAEFMGTLHQCFQGIRSTKVLFSLLLFSLFIQGARVFVHYCVVLAMGLDVGLAVVMYFTPMIAVVTALPISVGGIGPKEFMAGMLFQLVNVSVFDSTLKEWLAQGLGILISLPGGLLFLFMKSELKNEKLKASEPPIIISDVKSQN